MLEYGVCWNTARFLVNALRARQEWQEDPSRLKFYRLVRRWIVRLRRRQRTRKIYTAKAQATREQGDRIEPNTPMDCYAIAACEVLSVAYERIADGDCRELELFTAERRQARLAELYGVRP